MKALEVKNLTKRYPSFTLNGVSFSVEEGRVCGLVGANGAGKTTTLKGIMGLIQTEGEATAFSLPTGSLQAKSLIGYAGGGFRFYPQKRVKALAKTVSSFYPEWSNERFLSLLERFSLLPEKKISELSEGMKVKLSLALSLSHGAKLVILDEPTSGLDPLSREEFCDTVLSLVREEGLTVLFSTHITSDLERIADDVVLLSRGEVLVEASLKELAARYLLASCPEKREGLVGLKAVKEGYEGLVERSAPVEGVSLREPTLDEIVIHLEYARRQV